MDMKTLDFRTMELINDIVRIAYLSFYSLPRSQSVLEEEIYSC